MRTVFGIDVSKTSSEVAILVNGEKVHGYTMPNDSIGFNQLLGDLKTVPNPERLSLKRQASILVVFRLFLRKMATPILDSIRWKLRSNWIAYVSVKPIKWTLKS